MTFRERVGFGLGGAGFVLGTANNIFGDTGSSGDTDLSTITIAADRATAEATRDAYDAATMGWLANYTDIDVNIILYYTDSGTPTAQYQRRIGTSWVDNGPPVIGIQGQQGIQGPAGVGVDFTNFTDGDLLRYDQGTGTTAPAVLRELTNLVTSSRTISPPGERAIDIGPISAVSEGSTVSFLDRSRTRMFGAVVHDTTAGAGVERRSFYFRPQDTFTTTPSGANTSETFTGTTLQFTIVNANLGTAEEYRDVQRAAGSTEITGCNLTIRRNSHTDANPVFDFLRDINGGAGFTLNGGAGVTMTTVDLGREHLFLANETLYITVTGDGATPLNILGQTIGGQTVPSLTVYGRLGDITFLEDYLGLPSVDGYVLSSTTAGVRSWIAQGGGAADGVVDTSTFAVDASNNITLTLGRTQSLSDLTDSFQLIGGTGITLTPDTGNDTITISLTGAVGVGTDLRFGLSTQSDPALVNFASLTDVANPTDPQTVSTGTASAGDYFHIFNANTHPIETITDTVLMQVVYTRGAMTGNIFSFVADSRTENTITYNALTVGPLNAGVDEDYVLRYS